jgi:hypothetical protein
LLARLLLLLLLLLLCMPALLCCCACSIRPLLAWLCGMRCTVGACAAGCCVCRHSCLGNTWLLHSLLHVLLAGRWLQCGRAVLLLQAVQQSLLSLQHLCGKCGLVSCGKTGREQQAAHGTPCFSCRRILLQVACFSVLHPWCQ